MAEISAENAPSVPEASVEESAKKQSEVAASDSIAEHSRRESREELSKLPSHRSQLSLRSLKDLQSQN